MKDIRLAVLIDADNVPYANVKEMLSEVAKDGNPTIKRIYADWTKPTASGWKKVLLDNAITPIQQYSYTTGKNSSDSALIIDAMDILYSGKIDGFCIISSDSDFTRLAIRLREAGMKVIGIGEKKTPTPFITACDRFIYIEILSTQPSELTPNSQDIVANYDNAKQQDKPLKSIGKELVDFITESIAALADEAGWVYLGSLGNFILKKKPDFDSRNYGFPKLLPLIKSMDMFEINEMPSGGENSNVKSIFVKIR